ncbi:MAG: glycosyltransferase family 39 protein [Pseudomonadota bacterium]
MLQPLNPTRQIKESAGLFIPLWLVWGAALAFAGIGLGSYAILDNNEGLYAEVAREMLHSGDWQAWIIPRLNGLPYIEKPPLLYWLTAISFVVFGESEWAARLVPALSGLACVMNILWFGRKAGRPQTARLAALLFISSLGVILMSHTLMFDMLLTALLSAALFRGYLFIAGNDRAEQRWAMFFLALAMMAKGFVAVMLFCIVAGGFSIVSSASSADFLRRLRSWFNWKAIGIFLLISLPWHLLAGLIEPAFTWLYFVNEHVLRFLGRREPDDYYTGAWWYYLPRIVVFLFPWSLLIPALPFAGSGKSTDRGASGRIGGPTGELKGGLANRRLHLFLTLAWLMPLLFFSLSSAKANYYLIAVMPFAAFQLAMVLEEREFGSGWGRLLPGVLLGGVLLVFAWWTANQAHGALEALGVRGWRSPWFLSQSLVGLAVLSLLAGLAAWRRPGIGILSYMLLSLGASFILLGVLQASTTQASSRPLAVALQREYPGREIFMFRAFEEHSALPFYLKKPVYIIDSRSNDLFWGNKLHRNGIVVSETDFAGYAQSESAVIVVLDQDLPLFMTKSYYKHFRESQKIGNASLFLN